MKIKKIKADWQLKNQKHLQEIQEFNKQQTDLLNNNKETLAILEKIEEGFFEFVEKTGVELFDEVREKIKDFTNRMPQPDEFE